MCSPQPVASLEKPLPKGWRYELVAETVPKDVTSVVSIENVVSGKRSRKPPNWFAGAVVGTAPCSFKEAMVSMRMNACLNAVAKKLSSLEQHQVVRRPNIAFSTSLLGQFLNDPSVERDNALKHVLWC
ncbi:hypothetical protein O181_081797 [Austropuccinia psidii MF-1]|uniref:Uncharacterized protein n=1 Tax=Austropuccinia psidii MF-1 TaxID=1389203 RepID=A0A9Q3IIM7_9BASI|nr:hypothetical protein [Austropuccinia psidii MF-1]